MTVTEHVQLGNDLRQALEQFAATEEKCKRDLRTRTEAAQFHFKQQAESHATRFEEELVRCQTEYETARSRALEMREKRKLRIREAYLASKRQGLDRINNDEGRKKYPLQRGLLDTERSRVEQLKANDAALADFRRRLDDAHHDFSDLERQARKHLRGYRRFRRTLRRAATVGDVTSQEQTGRLDELVALENCARSELKSFRRSVFAQILRFLPIEFWILLVAAVATAAALAPSTLARFGTTSVSPLHAAVAGGVAMVLLLVVYQFSKRRLHPAARSIASALQNGRRLLALCPEMAEARYAAEQKRIESEAAQRTEQLQLEWRLTLENAAMAREFWPQKIEEKFRRASQRLEALHRSNVARLEKAHKDRAHLLKSDRDAMERQQAEAQRARLQRIDAEHETDCRKLQDHWRNTIEPLQRAVDAANNAADRQSPAWQRPFWENWTPPATFQTAAKFGRLVFDSPAHSAAEASLTVPLSLAYPHQGSILFETSGARTAVAIGALNNIIFRLLASTPAGKAAFTLLDPVRLGQNFATVMHLADYEENLINGRIWTQPNQIEEKLGEINEHIEKVIQMYLRNEYPTLADYNEAAGNIAEKYHFLVVADFPANFTDAAARSLLRIAASGGRCGVFVLMHWDHRHGLPADFLADELRKNCVCINLGEEQVLQNPETTSARVILDPAPDADFATWFLHKVGDASRGSSRVEVPFSQVAPDPDELWSLKTSEELRVPLGRSGATKLQYLSLGRGTRQHTLIAGKTGSGKSTLFHAIITNLSLWCSPDEVEFYLVDFKKGVEFKCYAANRLPHARVVAIESDREFGLSVLEKVDAELKRRGDLFRKAGVQDLPVYKATPGAEPMPRCLLIIDEFQELFVEDDRTAQTASVLLDRIVRQGRAFGIHVLLGSQTLGGAYTLARTTMGQMVVRIALQCNEADAYLIMDENNAAPRLLSRPGEGIYNDRAGAIEGNSPFQAVWLPEPERDDRLREIRALADERAISRRPVVFEGNAPADVAENPLFDEALRSDTSISGVEPRIWLGAPNAIKGPTEAAFEARGGNNLLIVGQRDEAIAAILSLGLVALAAQQRYAPVRIVVLDGGASSPRQPSILETIVRYLRSDIVLLRPGDSLDILHQLAEELHSEQSAADAKTFLLIHKLQNFRKLRGEDDFGMSLDNAEGGNPAADFQTIVTEGPSRGMHVIASLDTYNNVTRWLGRKTLSEFSMRVLFQMSAADSASLCDDPKASMLGLHRALFINEQQSYMETFRPYALPPAAWFEDAAQRLASPPVPQAPG